MTKEYIKLIINRINKFHEELERSFLGESINLTAKYGWCKNHVSFIDKEKLTYKPIFEGDIWGEKWDSAWFHLTGKVPKEWKNNKVVAHLDFSGKDWFLILMEKLYRELPMPLFLILILNVFGFQLLINVWVMSL